MTINNLITDRQHKRCRAYADLWRALQTEATSSTSAKGGFPTLPLRQREAASTTGIPSMHRGQQQKIVR